MSRIYDLLEKFASGTCSGEEFEELMQLLKGNENEESIRNELRNFYNSLNSEVVSDLHIDEQGGLYHSGEAGVEEGSLYHSGAPAPDERPRPVFGRRAKTAALALCALAAIVVGWNFFLVKPHNKVEDPKTVSRIYTPAGSRTSVVLPDGTEVWLNSFSTLTYSTAEFNSGRREVTLVGEAMFSVKHDSLHQFLVHTKNFDVTDLGTVFNISAYPEDKHAQASLISGSIEVITKGRNSKKVTLVPNQRFIVENENKTVVVMKSGAVKAVVEPTIKPIIINPQMRMAPDTAWMVNKLIFTDENFYDLALQMQRRYNVEIVFESEKARTYKFTGRFEEEDVEDALKELQVIAPFSYRRVTNTIYIK